MKLGFFTMPMHPPGRNYTQTLKEDREAVLLADKLGFCDAFIGEHVTDVCESIPSCLTFIASVAHDTKQIKLGSGTVNLPNNHRAQVGDFGTLLYASHDWVDSQLARRSMELMAEKVMPAVNAAIGTGVHVVL